MFSGQVFAEMLAGICHEEFYRYSDQEVSTTTFPLLHVPLTVANFQAFAIFITHTSFRLYHALFPKSYLQSLHDTGSVHQEVQLSASRLYDMCDPDERGHWLDVLIAMVEYLRSGENKVGYLNNSVEKNMLHKENEVHFEESVNGVQARGKIGEWDVVDESLGEGETVVGLRRSMRKRKAESSEDHRVMVKSRKR